MSAKWHRSRAWDDRFFPAWAWPAKFVLRAFSSITLAVILLTTVALYGVLASVPIGMLALLPTYLLYAFSFVAVIALGAGLPVWLGVRTLRARRPDLRALRFTVAFLGFTALAVVAAMGWAEWVWPRLRWDPVHATGLRLFPDFCAAYAATTMRRLPAFEMTELEYYSWWPLRVILLLFVLNMVVATVRRIEFIFPNIGVLTVHTGIVTLALGSMHYKTLKEEGDALLLASHEPGTPGPLTSVFYDNTDVALWANQDARGWEQRPLRSVPRYNDYGAPLSDRSLSLPAPPPPMGFGVVDPDISLRIVGYGGYVELNRTIAPLESPRPGVAPNPLIEIELLTSLPDQSGDASERVWATGRLAAGSPAQRAAVVAGVLAVEHVPASQAERWRALTTPLPDRGAHALVITIPGGDAPTVAVVEPGDVIEAEGFRVEVRELLPEPPFPIITPGYEGATSSAAVLRITTPGGESFDRYVYHRFPEINQDVLGAQPDGRPIRRDADPSIRIDLIDATMVQVYVREDGVGAVRLPEGDLALLNETPTGQTLSIAAQLGFRIAHRWPDSEEAELPVAVAVDRRQRDMVGTHAAAALGVEVSLASGWRRTVWLPFTKFMNVGMGTERMVHLPDGRDVALAFGRLSRPLPGIALELVDFEMIPYPHSEIPRDYISLVRVYDSLRNESYEHETRLNRPVIHRVPFQRSDARPFIANALGSVISVIAPNQYKFSQAGWDAEGWSQTLAETRAGRLDRPRAAFTILGVGNNPGIYIIAAGGVMMSVGIPWAFYIKPMILKRRKRRIQGRLAAESAGAATFDPSPATQPVESNA